MNCAKRHPKTCNFFNICNRCKFWCFCSFAHITTATIVSSDNEKIKTKLSNLEKRVETLENENKLADVNVQGLVEKNKALEEKLELTTKRIEDVCAITVKKVLDAVVAMIFRKQDENEKKLG